MCVCSLLVPVALLYHMEPTLFFLLLFAQTIMYETEPLNRTNRTIPISILKPSLAWTYSMLNVNLLESRHSLPTLYVPPSYSKVVNYGLRADLPRYPAKIEGVDRDKGFMFFLSLSFFLSCPFLSFPFPPAVTTVTKDLDSRTSWMAPYNISFENVLSAWTHQDWATKIASHHVLINVHKPGRTGLELFRLFSVLSSGMRVVSDRSHPEDEKLFEGLIHFAKHEEMAQKVQEFIEEGKDPAVRERVRREISRRYHERFSLMKILGEAIDVSEYIWRRERGKS